MKPWMNTLLSLGIAVVVSLALLWGGDRLTTRLQNEQTTEEVKNTFGELLDAAEYRPLDTASSQSITQAWSAVDAKGTVIGYAITAEAEGYAGTIEVHVAVNGDKQTVKGIHIGKHQETPGYGARIVNDQFREQFAGGNTPFALNTNQKSVLKDGTYRAIAKEYDSSGFRDMVELTVEDGEISAVNWDAEQQNGKATKKELSRNGDYVMTEDGLLWHQQAELLERVLLDTQDPSRIVYQPDTGKTDAYAGASIRISPFVKLAEEALNQARGDGGTMIDGISGATTSSRAVIRAVNDAVAFVTSA